MKLVKLLAKELKEWPEIDECSDPILFITQDSSGTIFSWNDNGELKFVDGQWYMQGTIPFDEVIFDGSETCSDCSSAIVREDQWRAEREKMNKPKWIRHRGGNTTLHPGTMIEARLRSGEIQRAIAGAFLWDNSLSDHAVNIMAYRIVEESKEQEINQVKDTNIGTLTYRLEIDATEATKEIDSLVAKWGQIESPLKWRDEIIELEAYEEEFRREREKLIRKLESEGFKLIGHVVPVYGEQNIDMSDWRNWQADDIVRVVISNDESLPIGNEYVVKEIESSEYEDGIPVAVFIIADSGDYIWPEDSEYKGRQVFEFVRRP